MQNKQPMANPAAKAKMDKIAAAAEAAMKDQLKQDNKKNLTRQYIILGQLGTLVLDIATKVCGDDQTFMLQDMS